MQVIQLSEHVLVEVEQLWILFKILFSFILVVFLSCFFPSNSNLKYFDSFLNRRHRFVIAFPYSSGLGKNISRVFYAITSGFFSGWFLFVNHFEPYVF